MRAHTSIPLLGYQVTAGPQADPRVFQLQQSGQLYTFKAESEELKGRWVKAMVLKDREAWRAVVHRVAKSQTRLSN